MAPDRTTVRIIGGRWRGRRLPVVTHSDLRPTPDRVRETVFNWLRPTLPGSRCLDLFAGTGALGFEALSRGAASVVFVEQQPAAAAALTAAAARLGASATVLCTDALAVIGHAAEIPFDLVFLDPPFGQDLLAPAIATLCRLAIVKAGGFLYIETPRDRPLALPATLHWHRQGHAGRVAFGLAVNTGA
ncbi:MAG: 16S rRNA (guanine(966)-N(2))-methyltransferase RsmD [Acidiferrobacter sp.]